MEYPSHAPARQRWFQLNIVPATVRGRRGAVLTHLDISARREAEARQRDSEAQYRQIAENVGDIFFLIDCPGGRISYVSPAFETIFGQSCEALYASPEIWLDAVCAKERAQTIAAFRAGVARGSFDFEYPITDAGGEQRWLHARGFPVRDAQGQLQRVTGFATDITERKRAESRLRYLTRVHAMLSGINGLIVRSREPDELFREACRIAVEDGRFRYAAIGIVDGSEVVRMAADAGDTPGLAELLRLDLETGSEAGRCALVREAVSNRSISVSGNVRSDGRLRRASAYADCGVQSLAVVPLCSEGRVVGVMALFADEGEFFHADECELLQQLADDIGFALEHFEHRDRVARLSYYDELTGLANRRLLMDHVSQYLRGSKQPKMVLYLLDIERFHQINHSFGQAGGDQLLRQLAAWLRRQVGDASLLARLEGDRFAVVLRGVGSARAEQNVEAVVAALGEVPFRLQGAVFRIAVRAGYASYPDTATSAEALFRNAEAALKAARVAGERALGYAPSMNAAVSEGLALEYQLREALDRGEFVLHYQPKFCARTQRLTGAEALIRWQRPDGSLAPPQSFIPKLEETGLIREVGFWALRQAVSDLRRLRALPGTEALRLAVNVSALQLRSRAFLDEIASLLGDDRALAQALELEITESVVMEDARDTCAVFRRLRAMGLRIAIDDFGTGFSSLSYLAELPVDTLKIDRSFVSKLFDDTPGRALVATIIELGHSLGMRVVAEGVEVAQQAEALAAMACDEVQGFLYGPGVPMAELLADRLPHKAAPAAP